MKCGRIGFVLILVLSLNIVNGKVFKRCELTRELLKINFHQKTFLSNWVCLIEQESDRNTAAHVVKSPRKQYYGLFQIGSEWCKEGRKGGRCNVACEFTIIYVGGVDIQIHLQILIATMKFMFSLLDDDIRDDSACALQIFEAEGFKYWTKWESRCKGAERLPDIEKCPDWQHPPSRASPERMKRAPRVIASPYDVFFRRLTDKV